MSDLFGEEKPKKAEKPPKEPFDLDAKLEEIKRQPKKSPLLKDFTPAVPWYGMFYGEVSRQGMEQDVLDHIHFELTPEQGIEYRKYLVQTLGFPNSWLVEKDF